MVLDIRSNNANSMESKESNRVEILTNKIDITKDEYLCQFPENIEPDNFQKHAFKSINKGNHVLITAHTGSGKTKPAEHAILYNIKKGLKVVYTCPIKSLSNEKYKDFSGRFKDFSIGILTGDNKINPEADLIIMTAEILRNSLYRLKSGIPDTNIKNDFIDKLGCVIMDEVHYISDPNRGSVWEETLVLLPKSVQLVMLSATIDKAVDFANWVATIKDRQVSLIPTDKRAVPLRHYVYMSDKIYEILDRDNVYYSNKYQEVLNIYKKDKLLREKKHKSNVNYNLIPELVEFLKREKKLQAIFFSFSRKNCQYYAGLVKKNLVNHEEMKEIEQLFNKYMHKYEKQYELLPQYQELKDLIMHGIAYHHSGLLPILKEIVEIIFQKGLIKVLFATETFAVGVNMPTRTVVFTELEKYTEQKKRFLTTAEYKQMSGRAGRRGIDTVGFTIILPIYNLTDELELKQILLGKVGAIASKFKFDYSFFLKVIQSNAISFDQFLESSLFCKEQYSLIKQLKLDIVQLIEEQKKLNIGNIPDEYLKLDYFLNDINGNNSNFKIVLDKEKQKYYKKLEQEHKNTPEYTSYCEYKKLENKIKVKTQDMIEIEKYVENNKSHIISYLQEIGFLIENPEDKNIVTEKDISQKGIIASHINECNALVLTEMIINDYFKNMTPEEIIGVIAIFIDDVKEEDQMSLNHIEATENIYNCLKRVNELISDYQAREQQHGIVSDLDYWKISFNYVDLAYSWACGYSYNDCVSYTKNTDMFEGNFIRNMLKIYNITHDISSLCKLSGKVELLPVLEKIDGLIIRDIVSMNSLYLSKN
jgi:superfamily II RNA helicase